ncbi:MAG: hypothetical protein OEX08_00735 [Candidatus Nomurabacteria bacterium]|nr:hypothetical protein [Candidatus Nomurabacteria bacterium]
MEDAEKINPKEILADPTKEKEFDGLPGIDVENVTPAKPIQEVLDVPAPPQSPLEQMVREKQNELISLGYNSDIIEHEILKLQRDHYREHGDKEKADTHHVAYTESLRQHSQKEREQAKEITSLATENIREYIKTGIESEQKLKNLRNELAEIAKLHKK